MSPTARQEYDAYMQNRLRMAAQSPNMPRVPANIQLGVGPVCVIVCNLLMIII
jgi:hypothetical protein